MSMRKLTKPLLLSLFMSLMIGFEMNTLEYGKCYCMIYSRK
ncbi:hypothetical protein VCRA2113O415_180015 [Vibrio crassostreae]|nr:hypothetical protein VCRA2113O415_180015 [Vibrio crassostreae]